MQALAFLAQLLIALQAPTAATGPVTRAAEVSASAPATAPTQSAGVITGPVLLAIPEDELAGFDEPERSSRLGSWEAARGARTGGAVAIVLGFYRPKMADINAVAQGLGFRDGFGNEAIFMNGIRAYGYIGRHFRIGGMILEGDATTTQQVTGFNRTLDLEINQGGITLEGVYPLRRWEFYGGALIGIASYEVHYTQEDLGAGTPNWNELMATFGGTPATSTFTKSFSIGYTAVEPWAGVKVKILPWLAIDTRVGYHWGKAGRGEWVFSDESRSGIPGSPGLDASGLSGSAEVTFGFFPY